MKRSKEPVLPQVVWHKEQRTLSLEGEPVLEYSLTWPEVQGAGMGGRWISRYYDRLARSWRLRWQREVYWKACLALAERRASSRPFTPWSGALSGEVVLWEEGLLSLRLEGVETRGDGRPNRVRWGDVWRVREGAPCPLSSFFPGERRWKKKLTGQIISQGVEQRSAGNRFLDQGWERSVPPLLPVQDFCLTAEGLEFAFPQCAFSPAAEGTPVFQVPLPRQAAASNTHEKSPA